MLAGAGGLPSRRSAGRDGDRGARGKGTVGLQEAHHQIPHPHIHTWPKPPLRGRSSSRCEFCTSRRVFPRQVKVFPHVPSPTCGAGDCALPGSTSLQRPRQGVLRAPPQKVFVGGALQPILAFFSPQNMTMLSRRPKQFLPLPFTWPLAAGAVP